MTIQFHSSVLAVVFIFSICVLGAQNYDVLIKNGHVIDPMNEIDAIRDVAIKNGKIETVASNLPPGGAGLVVDAEGLYVVPGLVDIHTHVFHGTEPASDYSNGQNALPPDGFTFRAGVTTIVDAGGSGWRDFALFKRQTIDQSQTRVLAFLNIVGSGMKGGPIEQNVRDMDPRLTALRVLEYPDLLLGVKVAHYRGGDWEPVDRAVEAGRLANVPVMVDFGYHDPPLSLRELLLDHLRPGDIFTHTYSSVQGRIAIVDDDKTVRRFAFEARKRGVIFDVGHGAGSFLFRQAVPAMRQGFPPDSISTDLHVRSMNGGMKDMLNVASKFLNMGMPLSDVISKATWNPARIIHREDLGNLSQGAVADVSLLRLRQGDFGFLDVHSGKMAGNMKLECELVLRAGKIVWDLNGISCKQWTELGPDY